MRFSQQRFAIRFLAKAVRPLASSLHRAIAAAVMPGLMLTTFPVNLTALTNSPDQPQAPAPAVHINRTLPAVTSPSSHFSLPTPATTLDLETARLFPEPLVPVGGKPTAADNAALAAALTTFASSRQLSGLESYIGANGQSPWLVSVLTNLGLLEFQNGFFSKALADWKQAWTLGKDDTSPAAQPIVNRAVAELVTIYNRIGRFEDSKAILAQVDKRAFHGLTANMMRDARQSVATMELNPAEAFKCGPFALLNILTSQHQQTNQTTATIKSFATTPQGTSLAQVLALANKIGLKMQVAKRVSGTELPLPAVVNWKLNHYGALLRQQGDFYLLVDPTFGDPTWVQKDAVNQEASGYFIIPAGPLPVGWVAVGEKEASTVWGRGSAPGKHPGCSGPHSPHQPPKKKKCGMADWQFTTELASLNITDTPLFYDPPVGGRMAFSVTYDAMEQNQMSTLTYSNIGSLWNFSWLSSVTIQFIAAPGPGQSGGAQPTPDVYVNMGAGGYEDYVFDTAINGYDPNPETNTTIIENSASSFERDAPDGSKMIFNQADSSGRVYLTQTVDAQGNTNTFTYDGNFRLVGVTDAIGQVSTLTYTSTDSSNPLFYKIATVTDPFGRSCSFTYDVNNELSQITDEIGMSSQFTYGSDDFINSMTTPYGTTSFALTQTTTAQNGNVTSLVATEPGGAQQRIDAVQTSTTTPDTEALVPAGMPVSNTYLEFRNSYFWDRKAMHDAPGDYTKASLTHFLHYLGGAVESDIIESTKEALENRVWYFYQNQDPTMAYSTNAGMLANPIDVGQVLDNGSTQLTQKTYNTLGFPTQEIDPAGRTTNYVYASNGIDLVTVLRVNGTSSDVIGSYTYNNQHLILTAAGSDGEATTLTYNPQGEQLTLTDAKNETTTNTYDGNGYLTSIQGPLAGSSDLTTLTYDAFKRVQTVTNGEGYMTTYAYDALNRVTSKSYPDGTSDQIAYTFLQPTQYTDRLGHATTLAYNGLQQLISMTDPLNQVTQYKRCTCGALLALIDPLGQTTSWIYDVEDRPVSKTYADGSGESYAYDATGRIKSFTDAKNQVKLYTYNVDDTPSKISYLNAQQPTPNVVMIYDPVYPRLTSVTDGIGVTTYTYNPVPGGLAPGANQIASVSGPWANSAISYSYDELGRILSRTVNGVTENATYDVLGRVPTVTNGLGSFTYTFENASDRILSLTRPNGQVSNYTYFGNTGDRRLQQITNLNADNSILSQFGYTEDAASNVLTKSIQSDANAPVSTTFTYDHANQLTNAANATNTYAYTYDQAGNRLTQTLNGTTATASYNGLNEIQQVAPALANDKTYSWDAENRLVGIAYAGGNLSTQFTYDGLGRCAQIVEKSGATTTSTKRFVWDGDQMAEEHNALDQTTRRFYGEGEQIGGANYFYTRDYLGSVRELTDSSGVLHARYTYDPFGTPTKVSGDLDASLGFTGHYNHLPSGLALALARAYDSSTGRWLSRDPAGEDAGPSLYAYVSNNPSSRYDPDGEKELGDSALSTAGIVAVAFAERQIQIQQHELDKDNNIRRQLRQQLAAAKANKCPSSTINRIQADLSQYNLEILDIEGKIAFDKNAIKAINAVVDPTQAFIHHYFPGI